jgi:hypothetical protein
LPPHGWSIWYSASSCPDERPNCIANCFLGSSIAFAGLIQKTDKLRRVQQGLKFLHFTGSDQRSDRMNNGVPPDDVYKIENQITLVACSACKLKQQVSHLRDIAHAIRLERAFSSQRKYQWKRARQCSRTFTIFILSVSCW